jgi:hypothetical protein
MFKEVFRQFLETWCSFENQPAPLLKKSDADQFVWRASQKFKPTQIKYFCVRKNILAWVRFKFLGNQVFIRGSANRIWLG